MGRAGIRRRKPAHHLPKVPDQLEGAEAARAFGNFRGGGFTPAGSFERFGFMLRQFARRRAGEPWPRLRDHELRGMALWLGVVAVGFVAVMLALGIS
jgi:hypothetical protein